MTCFLIGGFDLPASNPHLGATASGRVSPYVLFWAGDSLIGNVVSEYVAHSAELPLSHAALGLLRAVLGRSVPGDWQGRSQA